jgi:cytochrome c oxidase subunit 2
MDFEGLGMLSTGRFLLAESLSIFDPASPNAASILNLAILTLAVTGLIFLVVEGVLFYSIWRFREVPGEKAAGEPPQVYGSMPIEVAWTAAPTMIVFFLVLVTTRTLWEVKPNLPVAKAGDNTLFVTVIGHQWWWEYVYETYDGRKVGFITANELHIPASDDGVSRPTFLNLKSADVCHSYWVPRLGGKVDLIPGRTNVLVLETKETGLHLGQCAEYCGAQHANMLIRVIVHSPDDFERWLESESQAANEDPAMREGKEAFLAESCVNCHAIRGTPAVGTYAPDLTHLMARETLAGGMIKNTPEYLDQWVRDPQSIKPGCLMPAFGLDDRQLKLIVDYLQTLN